MDIFKECVVCMPAGAVFVRDTDTECEQLRSIFPDVNFTKIPYLNKFVMVDENHIREFKNRFPDVYYPQQ